MPLAGDGWSSRAEDAILHGCIPLVIMDDVHAGVKSVKKCGGGGAAGLGAPWRKYMHACMGRAVAQRKQEILPVPLPYLLRSLLPCCPPFCLATGALQLQPADCIFP